jgi:hypothetical protein
VIDIGLELALALQRLYPDKFKVDAMARLVGDDATIAALRAGETRAQIKARWAAGLAAYERRCAPILLYQSIRAARSAAAE